MRWLLALLLSGCGFFLGDPREHGTTYMKNAWLQADKDGTTECAEAAKVIFRLATVFDAQCRFLPKESACICNVTDYDPWGDGWLHTSHVSFTACEGAAVLDDYYNRQSPR